MATRFSRLVGGIYRCFSSKSHLIQSGPGLREFVKSGNLLNVTSSVAERQLDCHEDRVPYLGRIDIDGHGRKGSYAVNVTMTLSCSLCKQNYYDTPILQGQIQQFTLGPGTHCIRMG